MSVSVDEGSTATQLLEKRRQMKVVQETLEAQKLGYAEKEKAFARREDTLRNKDLELQEALVLFNRYLKQNEAKRRTAQYATENERKQKEQKIKEIAKKKKEFEELKEEKMKLEALVEQNEKYKKFLHKVYKDNPEDFEERDHIMYRYWSLKKTHQELSERKQRMEREKEELTRKLKDETKAQQTLSLELNNKYAKSTKMFEKILEDKSKEMAKIEHTESVEARRRLVLSSCVQSVENLYTRCCRNNAGVMNKPPILSNNKEVKEVEETVEATMKKLMIIKRYLEDFRAIVEMWKQEQREALLKKKTTN